MINQVIDLVKHCVWQEDCVWKNPGQQGHNFPGRGGRKDKEKEKSQRAVSSASVCCWITGALKILSFLPS